MIWRSTACALASAALLLAPAYASQPDPGAFLYCRGDEVAVRFNTGWGLDPLGAVFDAKWRDEKPNEDGRCILSDGKKVILKWRSLPAYAWGAGGAAPPSTFSLWINGVSVGGGEFVGGYGDYTSFLNSIFYSPGSLTVCHSDAGGRDGTGLIGPFTCAAKSYDLAAQRADWSAPDFGDPRGGEMNFITSGSGAFCRQFIRPQEDITWWAGTPPPPVFTFVNRGKDTRDMLAIDRSRIEILEFDDVAPGGPFQGWDNPAVAHFDAFGTGKPQTVIRLTGDYKQFRGQIMMAHDGEATPEDIAALAAANQNQFDGTFQTKAKLAGWHHLGGKVTPFTWHTVFRMDGKLYVMAVPEAAYYTTNPTPTAVLYETFAAGNNVRLTSEVCTFQLTAF